MSPAHRFHPEFGYFCPSPGLRRKLRIALACIVIGVVAGASGAIMLKAAHDPDPRSALMVLRTDEAAVSAETAPAASEAVVTPSVVTPERERPRPPEGNGQAACEQDAPASQTWAYLDGKCVSGRPRKPRAGRQPASGSAATAAPSGREAISATSTGPAAAAAGTPDRRPQASPPASPMAAVAATTQPTEQPAAAPKKVQKPPRSQSASREHDNVAGREGRRRDDPLGGRTSAAPDDRAVWHSPFERGPFNFFSR
ncbi:MAG TPA: hypothetical protein VFB88_19655 [Xanthobacteraceae bacterium]|nr:hypothetical protein [Xanthobacteraceae bacterium]